MKKLTNEQKLALLDKAIENDFEISASGWYQMSGTLDREMLESVTDPEKLDEPINWDMDEVVDYKKSTVVYEVTHNDTVKENLSSDELFDYLNKMLSK